MRKTVVGLLAVVLCVTAAPSAQAQRFGIQADFSTEWDFGIGARGEFDLTNVFTNQGAFSRAFIITSFDYFFADCNECTYWELNPMLAVPITVTNPKIKPYLGGGLNIARVSVDLPAPLEDASDTEIGLNLLGGLRFPLGGVNAYTDARIVIGDNDQLVLTFGFLFGGAGSGRTTRGR
jgi:hypothetical protein